MWSVPLPAVGTTENANKTEVAGSFEGVTLEAQMVHWLQLCGSAHALYDTCEAEATEKYLGGGAWKPHAASGAAPSEEDQTGYLQVRRLLLFRAVRG